MPLKALFFGLLFLVLSSLSACSRERHETKAIAATVNGSAITEDDLFLILPDGHGGSEASSGMRDSALDHLIEQELLYQEGLKLGLDRDPKYRNRMNIMEARLSNARRSEMARLVASTRISSSVTIRPEDVSRYYEQNKDMIANDLRLFVLRFTEEDKARKIRERLDKGADFHAVASEMYPSPEQDKPLPWDTGFLRWDQIPLEWTKAVYSLPDGAVSGILGTSRTGWCIAKVAARRNNPDAALSAMTAAIENRLRDLRIAEAYEVYLQDLKRTSRIVKNGERRNSS